MELPRKTPQVARELGCSYSQLFNLIRTCKFLPPLKDSSGDYVWSERDVSAARQALAEQRGSHEPATAG